MPLGLLMLQRYKLSLVIAITSFALLAALAVGMAIIGIRLFPTIRFRLWYTEELP
ncbi:MAG: hypothetical protein OHK0050_31960 [Roseiflexaceae bacterium]